MREDIWYDIYLLIDPFIMQVFYVGVAEDYVQRYSQHLQMKDDNERKAERISAIKDHGSLPLVYREMKVYGGKNALFCEALYISVFLLCNQPLTNREMRIYDHDQHFVKLRDILVSVYKGIGIHVGVPFPMTLHMLTPEMSEGADPKLVREAQQAGKDMEAALSVVAKELGSELKITEYKDIYGTHRVRQVGQSHF